jgi:hypothetical protein
MPRDSAVVAAELGLHKNRWQVAPPIFEGSL